MGTFGDRVDELIARVGVGTVVAKVEVDQVYAHRQHEEMDVKHPRGGGPKYLERPLFDSAVEFYQHIADDVLDRGVVGPMIDNAELLAHKASDAAPRLFDHLAHSMHPSVIDDGVTVYDRPPEVARIPEKALVAEKEAVLPPKHYYGHWPPEHLKKYAEMYGMAWPYKNTLGRAAGPPADWQLHLLAQRHFRQYGGLRTNTIPTATKNRLHQLARAHFVKYGYIPKRGRPKGSKNRKKI